MSDADGAIPPATVVACAGGVFAALSCAGLFPVLCYSVAARSGGRCGRRSLASCCSCLAAGVLLSACFTGMLPQVGRDRAAARLRAHERPADAGATGAPPAPEAADRGAELCTLFGFLGVFLLQQIAAVAFPTADGDRRRKGRREYAACAHGGDARALLLADGKGGEECVSDGGGCSASGDATPERQFERQHGEGGAACLDFRSLALLLTMCSHAVLEGVALGLQSSRPAYWQLLLAVMLHEVLCAWAYGLTASQASARSKAGAIGSCLLLACMIPLGMVCGHFVPKLGFLVDSKYLLEAVAAGSFVYVAAVQMVGEQFGRHSAPVSSGLRLAKVALVLLGAVALTAVRWAFGL